MKYYAKSIDCQYPWNKNTLKFKKKNLFFIEIVKKNICDVFRFEMKMFEFSNSELDCEKWLENIKYWLQVWTQMENKRKAETKTKIWFIQIFFQKKKEEKNEFWFVE